MPDPIHAYLLLDTSASMAGAPLEALKQALQLLCGTFVARSKRPIQMSLIRYDSQAQVITGLADVNDFDMPLLEAGGSSGLGGALRLVGATAQEYDPTLVYIFTDGDPTDDWELALGALKPTVQRIYAFACGPAATTETLEPHLDRVFRARELTPDALFETFRTYN